MKITDYEMLYDLPAGEYDGRGFRGVRTVTVRAGASLEVMCYPCMPLTAEAKREAKARRTKPGMDAVNRRNTQRHVLRLIENNFTPAAVVFTGTYAYPQAEYGMCNLEELTEFYMERKLPWDVERVKKDARNFLAKLRRMVKKAAGDVKGFRWILRIEEGVEPPVGGLPPKYHIHALIEGPGLTRDAIEAAWWAHGGADTRYLDLRDDGSGRLSNYLTKQRRGGRWWSHSRNLKAPRARVSDRRMSRRRLSSVAADVQRNGREIFEALYPGYRVVELPDVKYSDFMPGAYIYCRMRRME